MLVLNGSYSLHQYIGNNVNIALDIIPPYKSSYTSSAICFCIAGLTLYLFLSPLEWWGRQFLIDPFTGLLLIMLPIAWFVRPQAILRLQTLHFSLLPTLLFSLIVAVYLINENFLGVHIFSAALCVGAVYSLLGLILPAMQWRALFLPSFLLILLLPFEGYLDVYLGFPLRLLCADWAGEMLRVLGFTSITNESIILIEEKAANVDLGCSGIKGLRNRYNVKPAIQKQIADDVYDDL